MLHFFNKINKQKTAVLSSKEEFGLLNEHRQCLPHFGKGDVKIISYDSWAIFSIQLQKCLYKQEAFNITTNSKCIVFNLDQKHEMEWSTSKNHTYKIKPQTGTFFNTIEKHFELNLTKPLNILIIELRDNYFDQGLFHPSLKQLIHAVFDEKDRLSFAISKRLSSFLEEINQSSKRGVCQLMFLNAKVFEVLSEITDDLETLTEGDALHPYQDQLDQIKELIDTKIHIQFSINELAKTVGLNTSYLKKYFKEAFNETIFEYATRKRIDYAKELLETSDLPISTISEKIGYQQSAHFSYAFKKNTGLTPNQYRKNFN
ncbi:helix-turn-helix domain-containing protein [Flammeovirga aprica]|uniref:Helix-turn-helix transcriptional regulator n=1 Tax=Flammeovirga aprica JL-4 TaxID=694437 RepID=A0A7X9RSY0_9BACT|nr:AraC family transcriptional regulator [Flammeovirga aprica]NME66542.1 helix-turn-helix transcriptional regulator [Flammeovirga aprica JL-4]